MSDVRVLSDVAPFGQAAYQAMNRMQLSIPLASVLLLSACATTPTPSFLAKPVPVERLLALQKPGQTTTAKVVVSRDQGHVGSACLLTFYVDGKFAARIDVGERATFFVNSGEVLLKVGWDPQGQGFCSFGGENWTQRETVLKPGETKLFRLTTDQNAKLDVIRSDV